MLRRWFRFSIKRRRQNTSYMDEESNYIVCCKSCFENIESYWDERWQELHKEQMLGLSMIR